MHIILGIIIGIFIVCAAFIYFFWEGIKAEDSGDSDH